MRYKSRYPTPRSASVFSSAGFTSDERCASFHSFDVIHIDDRARPDAAIPAPTDFSFPAKKRKQVPD